MKRALISVLCLLALGACSRPAEDSGAFHFAAPSVSGSGSPRAREDLADAYAPPEAAPAPAPTGGKPAPAVSGVPRLAYRYTYGLEMRASAITGLLARHQAACRAAGAMVCQVTGSSITQDGGRITGVLHMRAEPQWLARFRDVLAGEARAAGGRVTRNETDTEDLSASIVDTEASLRAQMTLRDRLQNLLATRPGKLEELLAVERQLAEVQGQIDSATSLLAMMRQRVDTSQISITYESTGVLSQQGAWKPVAEAIRASQGVMASTIAFIILAISVLIPLGLVAALVWVVVRRLMNWRKARKPKAQKTRLADV